MRNVVTCWAPECAEQIEQPATGRGRRYHSAACKQRAFRRNGGKGPSEPYPPLGPDPLHQVAPTVTVTEQSEQKAEPPHRGNTPEVATAGGSDAEVLGQARPTRRGRKRTGNVTPPAVATAGKAPAPTAPPQGATGSPETVASTPGGTVTQLHIAVTEDSTVPVQIVVHPMVAQYKADLERMGISETRQGLHIIAMAEKLVSSSTSASAATNVSRELERLMAVAEQASPEAQIGRDPSVAIRERTLAKLRAVTVSA